MKNPSDLMLVLPYFINWNKRKKLLNNFQVFPEHLSSENNEKKLKSCQEKEYIKDLKKKNLIHLYV